MRTAKREKEELLITRFNIDCCVKRGVCWQTGAIVEPYCCTRLFYIFGERIRLLVDTITFDRE